MDYVQWKHTAPGPWDVYFILHISPFLFPRPHVDLLSVSPDVNWWMNECCLWICVHALARRSNWIALFRINKGAWFHSNTTSNTSVFTHVMAAGYLTLECCVGIDSFRKHWSASAALLASFLWYVQYWRGKAFDCHHPLWVPPLLNPSGRVKALPRASV